jgi:ABC-type glutathione transport system ATPase component
MHQVESKKFSSNAIFGSPENPLAPGGSEQDQLLAHAQELTIRFGDTTAVDAATIGLDRGEIVGLMGASGSGKSTLARALIGRLPKGAAITSGKVWRRGRAALLAQEPALSLSPYLRAGDQVKHVAERARSGSLEKILRVFEALGLSEPARVYRAYPHELSGGEKQRVVWAQAFMRNPDFLVADEPTTALDPIRQREIVEQVTALAREQKVAVLWVSHDPHLLRAVASRMVVLDAGRVVEEGPSTQIWTEPKAAATRLLLETSQ